MDQNGDTVTLVSLIGRRVVLYFYPKDDTPGCTKEACGFRDAWDDLKKTGTILLGVSPDSTASHQKFASKYKLPFQLLEDPDHALAEKYGVWGKKKFMGRTYTGVHRTTFLIDAKGRIANVWEKVKPELHAQEILEALRQP